MKTEHESTTQKHMKNIPYRVRRILLKTNLQWAKEKNTMWKMKMKLVYLTNHNQNFNMRFIYYITQNKKKPKDLNWAYEVFLGF